MNWEAIARSGYEVYLERAREFGAILPSWTDLQPAVRYAWVGAAKEICDIHAKAVLA